MGPQAILVIGWRCNGLFKLTEKITNGYPTYEKSTTGDMRDNSGNTKWVMYFDDGWCIEAPDTNSGICHLIGYCHPDKSATLPPTSKWRKSGDQFKKLQSTWTQSFNPPTLKYQYGPDQKQLCLKCKGSGKTGLFFFWKSDCTACEGKNCALRMNIINLSLIKQPKR